MAHPIEFWFDFASPYSYLAAMRIPALAREADVEILWQPVLLGPIFADRGWSDSPFKLFPDKGRYMWRDVAREAEALSLPFGRPSIFPVHPVLASRVTLVALDAGFGEAFLRGAFSAHFQRDQDLAREEVIDAIAEQLGQSGAELRARANTPAIKQHLRDQVERARNLGIFGAPTFVVGGELFWGNDRLERALSFAQRM
jgi:2-hydroxychromene-2-carboxylate isomerase